MTSPADDSAPGAVEAARPAPGPSPGPTPGPTPGPAPGLRPVAGTAADILALLREWDAAGHAEPLAVETSGSTGRPKRVLLSRAAMRASADATHERLGGPGRWWLALPPTYVAGLQVLFRSVRAGTEPVVVEAGDLADAVPPVGPSDARWGGRRYVSLVPTQVHRLLADEAGCAVLAGFDAVLVGGSALDVDLRARAERAGVTVVTTYGMSETCGGCVYDGRPLAGVAVDTGADGRVRIGGPVVFDGYEGDPELTAQVLHDGRFATADLGRVDPDGTLHVTGRVDDVVVSGGVNVSTSAVAARLRRHPGVASAEVLGVPDAEWGQAVVAVVVPDPAGDDEVDLAGLRDWVSAALPRAWAPRRVVTVAELPQLSTGKPDRLRLRELARG